MKNKGILILTIALLAGSFSSCKKGCTDPNAKNYDASSKKNNGSCVYNPQVSLNFTHNFNGSAISTSNFDQLDYVNDNGETMSFTRLRYSISDVRFYLASGDSIVIEGYHLIDIENDSTLTYTLPERIEENSFTGMAFTYGFNEADNISGHYTDLNAASWSWPSMLGGGYHQMQLEGRYINTSDEVISYQFHMGSRIRKIEDDVTTYHPNYVHIPLASSDFDLTSNTNIEIKMDLAEWFKSPNSWDFNIYYSLLMSNYDAQIMMHENSHSVFSIGAITH